MVSGSGETQAFILKRQCAAEVFVRLVAAAVFKTVEWPVKPVIGGFDSHTLPPFFSLLFPWRFGDSLSFDVCVGGSPWHYPGP